MKRLLSIGCVLQFFVLSPAGLVAQSPDQREKIAEGEYWTWESGRPIKDTAQTWTIWRTTEGFEIESKLPPNKGALLLAAMGHELIAYESPELREEQRNAAAATEITIHVDNRMSVSALHIGGKSLADGKSVLIADCGAKNRELRCKGRLGSSRIKDGAECQILYSEAEPLLYFSLLKRAIQGIDNSPSKIVLLQEVKNKPQLTELVCKLVSQGSDNLTIGDHVLNMEKYVLTLEGESTPRRITLWASKQGVVFGMEDSRMPPGTRILLSQFKKYVDF